MIIFCNRQYFSALVTTTGWVVANTSLHYAPTIILPSCTIRGLEINFLTGALTHIGNIEIMREPVERNAPWISKPIGPDFLLNIRVGISGKGVGTRNCIKTAIVHIDTQDLSKKAFQILSIV